MIGYTHQVWGILSLHCFRNNILQHISHLACLVFRPSSMYSPWLDTAWSVSRQITLHYEWRHLWISLNTFSTQTRRWWPILICFNSLFNCDSFGKHLNENALNVHRNDMSYVISSPRRCVGGYRPEHAEKALDSVLNYLVRVKSAKTARWKCHLLKHFP